MTEREALKLALEALLWANEEINGWMDDAYGLDPVDHPEIMSAINAIKEALAQPAQQRHISYVCPQCYWSLDEQPAQQEPFGHVTVRRLSQRFENHADQYHFYRAGQSPYLDNVDECYAVYTRPQARKPLTDEQREEIAKGWRGRNWTVGDIIDATEAAHGIKENP